MRTGRIERGRDGGRQWRHHVLHQPVARLRLPDGKRRVSGDGDVRHHLSGSSGGGDATSGYHPKVMASYRYIPTIVPATLFGDTMLEQSAVVRLQ